MSIITAAATTAAATGPTTNNNGNSLATPSMHKRTHRHKRSQAISGDFDAMGLGLFNSPPLASSPINIHKPQRQQVHLPQLPPSYQSPIPIRNNHSNDALLLLLVNKVDEDMDKENNEFDRYYQFNNNK